MRGRRRVQLAAVLLTSLTWASAAEAQRTRGQSERTSVPQQRAGTELERPSRPSLPDVECSTYLTHYQGGDNPIANGSRVPWRLDVVDMGGIGPLSLQGSVLPSYWVSATVINSGAGEAKIQPAISITSNGKKVPSSPTNLTWITLAPKSSKWYGPYRVGPLPNGSYKIAVKVIADVGNFQAESNETNNTCDWQATIQAAPFKTAGVVGEPNLELTSVAVDHSNWKATARVKNTGTAASEPFKVGAVFVGMPGCAHLSQGIVMSQPSGLSPGGEAALSKVLFPQFLPGVTPAEDCMPAVGAEFTLKFFILPKPEHVCIETSQYHPGVACGAQDTENYVGKRQY